MATLADIHKETRALCEMKFGFGVSLDFLQRAVDSEIQQITRGPFLKNMPFPYAGLAVTCELAAGSIKVHIPSGSSEFSIDAQIGIVIHIDGDRKAFLAEDTITYANGKAIVTPTADGKKLKYSAGAHGKYTMKLGSPPANLDALLTKIGMVDSTGSPDVGTFNLLRSGALTTNYRAFFVSLANSLPFPDLLGSLSSFRPLQPLLIGSTSSHFMVYSENVEVPGSLCPKGGTALHELTWGERDPKSGVTAFTQDTVAHDKIALDNTNSRAPNKSVKILSGNAFIYYFPQTMLVDYSFGKLKPSVTFSDSGNYCGIDWYFALTAALKGISISFAPISPTEGRIVVDVPFQIFGQAGASVTIGCVDYNVANLACHGDADPFTFEVLGGYDTTTHEIYLTTVLTRINVNLKWATGYGFPMDQIADWLLNRAMDSEARSVIGRRMDIFRLPIADLYKLQSDGIYTWNFESNASSDSVIYSLDAGTE